MQRNLKKYLKLRDTKGKTFVIIKLPPPANLIRVSSEKAGMFWPNKSWAGVESTPAWFWTHVQIVSNSFYSKQIEMVFNEI